MPEKEDFAKAFADAVMTVGKGCESGLLACTADMDAPGNFNFNYRRDLDTFNRICGEYFWEEQAAEKKEEKK